MADTTGHTPNTPVSRSDPLLTFMFTLEGEIPAFDAENKPAGTTKLDGYFTEISGPGDEHDVVEFKTIDSSGHEATILLPGRNETNEITLKRGLTKDMTFWKWRQLVRDGKIDSARTNLSIIMYNRRYEPIVRWNIGDAWPKKITAPDFQAGSSDFGVEEITVMYHSLEFEEYTAPAPATPPLPAPPASDGT